MTMTKWSQRPWLRVTEDFWCISFRLHVLLMFFMIFFFFFFLRQIKKSSKFSSIATEITHIKWVLCSPRCNASDLKSDFLVFCLCRLLSSAFRYLSKTFKFSELQDAGLPMLLFNMLNNKLVKIHCLTSFHSPERVRETECNKWLSKDCSPHY